MAFIPSGLQPQSAFPNYDQLKTYLSGGGAVSGSQTAPQGVAQPQTLQTASNSTQPGGPPLSGQFSETLTATQKQLQDMGNQFREQAGEGQSFDALGGGRRVDELLSGPSSNQDILKSWLNAKYQGPTTLDPTKVGEVQSNVQGLQGLAGAMKTPGGIANILQSERASYTPGEARFEAGYLRTDPAMRQQAAGAQKSVQDLQEQLKRETEQAGQLATQRQQQAGQLAADTKGYLSGKKQGIETLAKHEMDQRQAEQQRLASLYLSGDTSAPEITGQVETTETGKKKAEAEAKWAEIMAKYPTIANMPTLSLDPSYHREGNRRLIYSVPESIRSAPGSAGMFEQGTTDPQIWSALLARQQELEPYFGYTGLLPGQYSDVKPMYFTETPGQVPYSVDYGPYLQYDPGTGASLGNVLSQEDIALYNTLASLLGTGDSVTAGDYRAPSYGIDLEGYAQAENYAREQAARDPLRKWQNFAYGFGLS